MTIDVKPERERIIQEEIDRGRFRTPDEVVDYALSVLHETEVRQKAAPRKNLAQFLMESPLAGADLSIERQQDFGRPIEL
jgi:Arc/MetJ-type ribon-helix-helix transcriptional regulator